MEEGEAALPGLLWKGEEGGELNCGGEGEEEERPHETGVEEELRRESKEKRY